ncbi:MAG: hypothetical protein DMG22_00650 [Acidobacteria bacterium]|nr:MAG: hypothetical protein DMG22_00650 [Acidobacteriota bacterium]
MWTANIGDPPGRHWVLVVSLNARNESDRVNSVLVVPFSSRGAEGPTVLPLPAGETGLPDEPYLKAHFISTLPKSRLLNFTRRQLSSGRMREVVNLIRRAIDPDAPYESPENR